MQYMYTYQDILHIYIYYKYNTDECTSQLYIFMISRHKHPWNEDSQPFMFDSTAPAWSSSAPA